MPGNFYTVTLQEIANWPKPNYDNPEQRTWLPPYAIAWDVVSSILVFGRLYLRLRSPKASIGLDDVFIFIAWGFSVAFTTTACVSVYEYDVGRHVWDVRPANYVGSLYWAWIAQVMFLCSNGATKMSVLLFYRRMLKDMYSKAWIYAVYFLLFVTIASCIAIFFCYMFICIPLDTYWDIHAMVAVGNNDYKCINGDALTIFTSVLLIASDFWTAALPCVMFQYHDLGMSPRQKLALNIIFCLGFLVTGVGIARTYYLWQVGHDQDLSWNGYDLFVASVVECQLAIICTCLPFCRAFVRRYFPDLTTRTYTSNTQRSHGHEFTMISRSTYTARDSFGEPLNARQDTSPVTAHPDEKGWSLVREQSTGRLIWTQTSI